MEPRELVHRYVEFLQVGQFDRLDEILAPDVYDHVGTTSDRRILSRSRPHECSVDLVVTGESPCAGRKAGAAPPRGLAHNLPAIYVPLIVLAGFLHAKNLRSAIKR